MGTAIVQDATGAPVALLLPEMTYEEFLVHPDVPEHAEWVNGKAVAMGTVTRIHNDVVQFLVRLLGSYLDFSGSGHLFHDPFNMKLRPGAPGRAPDVFILLNAHLDRVQENHIAGPADIAVEVISPGSAATDRGDKFYEYEAGGVTEYWLIDPHRQVAEFYRLDDRSHYVPVTLIDGHFESAVLAGFRLPVAWLWDRPKLREAEAELGIR